MADWRETRRRLQVPGGRAQQAAVESRAVVADAGRDVGVDVAGVDASGLQRVALQVQRLGAVCLRDAGVADPPVSQTVVWDTRAMAEAVQVPTRKAKKCFDPDGD